jgi:Flp pilus assembly protein protease CpaA
MGGLRGLAEGICGCVILALPFVVLFIFARGGAGDAKLMGALGAWLGITNGLITLVCVLTAGVTWGLGFSLAKKRFRGVVSRMMGIVSGLILFASPKGRLVRAYSTFPKQQEMLAMPYGVSILTGVCIAALGVFLWDLWP